jgi:hypothetical protein
LTNAFWSALSLADLSARPVLQDELDRLTDLMSHFFTACAVPAHWGYRESGQWSATCGQEPRSLFAALFVKSRQWGSQLDAPAWDVLKDLQQGFAGLQAGLSVVQDLTMREAGAC